MIAKSSSYQQSLSAASLGTKLGSGSEANYPSCKNDNKTGNLSNERKIQKNHEALMQRVFTYQQYVDFLRGVGTRKLNVALKGVTDVQGKMKKKGLRRRRGGKKKKIETKKAPSGARGLIASLRAQKAKEDAEEATRAVRGDDGNVKTTIVDIEAKHNRGASRTKKKSVAKSNAEMERGKSFAKSATSHIGLNSDEDETNHSTDIRKKLLAFEKRLALNSPKDRNEEINAWIRVNIASKKWFENFILAAIIINCILLAMYNPLNDDDHWTNVVTTYTDPIFLTVFVLEMILKMMAFGLLRRTLTQEQLPKMPKQYYSMDPGYFMDGWNYIDFIVVLFGIVATIPGMPNVTAIRVIRVLRPLRAVKRIPALRVLVSVLLLSVVAIARVALILSLLFFIFGIAGVTLFGGVLHQRCFDSNGMTLEGDRVCSTTSAGLFQCPNGYSCKADAGNPFFGVVSFDDFPSALLQIFQTITMASWSNILYALMDGVSPFVFIYFFLLILLISFFALNLMLAAIEDTFSERQKEAEEEQKEEQKKIQEAVEANQRKSMELKVFRLSKVHDQNKDERKGKPSKSVEEEKRDLEAEIMEMDLDQDPQAKMSYEFRVKLLQVGARQLREWIRREQHVRDSQYMKWLRTQKLPHPPRTFRKMQGKQATDWLQSEGLKAAPFSFWPLCNEDALKLLRDAEERILQLPGMEDLSFQHGKGKYFTGMWLEERPLKVANYGVVEAGKGLNLHSLTSSEKIKALEKFHNRMQENRADLLGDFDLVLTDVLRNTSAIINNYKGVDYTKQWLRGKPAIFNIMFQIGYSTSFRVFILIVILLNTIALCYNHYGISDEDLNTTNLINTICAYIFLAEMVIKIAGFGLWGYWSDNWNKFDAVVVIASFIPNADQVSGLRTLRLLRIFKLFNSIPELRKLLVVVLVCLSQVGWLVLLVFIFLFMFSILGLQLYAGQLRKLEEAPRWRFDDLWSSLLIVFMCVTGDSWPNVMWDTTSVTSDATPLFFIMIVVLGDFMIINLFIAMLLVQFENDEKLRYSIVADVGKEKMYKGETPAEIFQAQDSALKRLKDLEMHEQTINQIQYTYYVNERKIKQHLRAGTINQLSMQLGTSGTQSGSKRITKNRGLNDSPRAARILKQSSDRSDNVSTGNNGGDSEKQNRPPPSLIGSKRVEAEEKFEQPLSPAPLTTVSTDMLGQSSPLNAALEDENILEKRQIAHGTSFSMRVDHPVRSKLLRLVEMRWFKDTVTACIAINCIFLAVEDPHAQKKNPVFLGFDIIFTIIFASEMCIKIVALGIGPRHCFLWGDRKPQPGASREEIENWALDRTYFGDPFNRIDGSVVILAAMSFIPGAGFLKFVRALRPLRILVRSRNTKVVLLSTSQAIPSAINIVLFILVFFVIFGILCVDEFKGSFFSCNLDVKNKQQCLDQGGEWSNQPYNYDNMYEALLTLFRVSTLSSWNVIMYNSIDTVGIDQQPRVNNSPAWGILYIVFIFICALFAMNLFVAVLIDKFNEQQERLNGSAFLTESQRAWKRFYKLASVTKLPRASRASSNSYIRICQRLVGQPESLNDQFEIFVLSSIAINAVVIASSHYQEPQELTSFIIAMNAIFNVIFLFEAVAKLLAWGPKLYFQGGWNRFDFFIVAISFISYGLDGVGGLSALRLFRLARLVRMVGKVPALKKLFDTLVISASSLWNVGALIFVVFFIYAVLGVFLFGRVAWSNSGLSQHANFVNFPSAIITLWRLATGDAWEEIQTGIQIQESSGLCSNEKGNCGYPWAPIYTLTFMVFVGLVMVNLFIAVILEGFAQSASNDAEFVPHLHGWRDGWSALDPQATGLLPVSDVIKLCLLSSKPIGVELGDVESFNPNVSINLMYHLAAKLPLRIVKVPVVEVERRPSDGNQRISPIVLADLKEKRTAKKQWVCTYTDTLTTIAKAMFEDFTEEDAKSLQKDFGLAEQTPEGKVDVKSKKYKRDYIHHWYAVQVIEGRWRARPLENAAARRKQQEIKSGDGKKAASSTKRGHRRNNSSYAFD